MKNFRMAIVVLAAILLVAVTEMGRTAVNRVADYREITAPKSLHQLSQEARADDNDRGGTLLMGAGLAALALACAGLVAFGLPAGREFGRAAGRRRRKARRTPAAGTTAPAPMPTLRVLPPAPPMRSLPAQTEEGRYEDHR